MDNKVQQFLNDNFGEVRVIKREDESIWFVANDVAEVLQYDITTNMTRNLDDDERAKIKIKIKCGNWHQRQNCLIINKQGLHKALTSTRKICLTKKQQIYKWLTNNDFEEQIYKSCSEIEFVNSLEETLKVFNINGIKQYTILNYKIDYYIPSLKLAIEYDENHHNCYTYAEQEGRQLEIEKELGCKFIRVSDKNTNSNNIEDVIIAIAVQIVSTRKFTEKGRQWILNEVKEFKENV